jgi:hypothetical protein
VHSGLRLQAQLTQFLCPKTILGLSSAPPGAHETVATLGKSFDEARFVRFVVQG